jgi:hypothetical protein
MAKATIIVVLIALIVAQCANGQEEASTIMTATIDATDGTANMAAGAGVAGVETIAASLIPQRAAIGQNCTSHNMCQSDFCFLGICRADGREGTQSSAIVG